MIPKLTKLSLLLLLFLVLLPVRVVLADTGSLFSMFYPVQRSMTTSSRSCSFVAVARRVRNRSMSTSS